MLEVAKDYYFQRKTGVSKAVKYIITNPTVYTQAIQGFNQQVWLLIYSVGQPLTLAEKSKIASDRIY